MPSCVQARDVTQVSRQHLSRSCNYCGFEGCHLFYPTAPQINADCSLTPRCRSAHLHSNSDALQMAVRCLFQQAIRCLKEQMLLTGPASWAMLPGLPWLGVHFPAWVSTMGCPISPTALWRSHSPERVLPKLTSIFSVG